MCDLKINQFGDKIDHLQSQIAKSNFSLEQLEVENQALL